MQARHMQASHAWRGAQQRLCAQPHNTLATRSIPRGHTGWQASASLPAHPTWARTTSPSSIMGTAEPVRTSPLLPAALAAFAAAAVAYLPRSSLPAALRLSSASFVARASGDATMMSESNRSAKSLQATAGEQQHCPCFNVHGLGPAMAGTPYVPTVPHHVHSGRCRQRPAPATRNEGALLRMLGACILGSAAAFGATPKQAAKQASRPAGRPAQATRHALSEAGGEAVRRAVRAVGQAMRWASRSAAWPVLFLVCAQGQAG